MYDRIERFISLMWDAIRYAVFLNWDAFDRRMEDLRGWWNGFVDDVYGAINWAIDQVEAWAQSWFDWISSWIDWAGDQINALWADLSSKFYEARQYAYDIVIDAYTYIDQWVNWLIGEIGKVDDWAKGIYYDWIVPAFEGVWANIDSLWEEVFSSWSWWKSWLGDVYGVVNWYVDQALEGLSLFLSDPVGFVFGVYKDMILFWLEGVDTYGVLLWSVITEYLADIYNFWADHGATLWEFFSDPVPFILDHLTEPFIDWFAGLVADNW